MAKQEVMKKIKELISSPWWEEIEKVLKNRRADLIVKILYHTGIEEKTYSEADIRRHYIRFINWILDIPNLEVPYEMELTEEMIAKDEWEIDIWDVDELFTTRE